MFIFINVKIKHIGQIFRYEQRVQEIHGTISRSAAAYCVTYFRPSGCLRCHRKKVSTINGVKIFGESKLLGNFRWGINHFWGSKFLVGKILGGGKTFRLATFLGGQQFWGEHKFGGSTFLIGKTLLGVKICGWVKFFGESTFLGGQN